MSREPAMRDGDGAPHAHPFQWRRLWPFLVLAILTVLAITMDWDEQVSLEGGLGGDERAILDE